MCARAGDGAYDATERVLTALRFEKPDRVPIYDGFWPEFEQAWRRAKGMPDEARPEDCYSIDVRVEVPNETPFPRLKATLESSGDSRVVRNGWGQVQRRRGDAKFYEVLEVALTDKSGIDGLTFESPLLDCRYRPLEVVEELKCRRCVFVKTGGPYLRTSNLRGTTQWLMDLAEDEAFARELAMRVTRHMTAVGLEGLRRYDLFHTGIWFFDDMASNRSPMFSPGTFERVLLPCYRWMCEQYRAAGVAHILLHSDGNIGPVLDMLIDAGIDAFHPIEPKAGMDVVELRKKYGDSIALLGGLDNAHILPRGTEAEVEAHVAHVLEAGRDGGFVVGTHSIGPDVSVERYDFVHRLLLERGRYS